MLIIAAVTAKGAFITDTDSSSERVSGVPKVPQDQEQSNPGRSELKQSLCTHSANKHKMSTYCMPQPVPVPGYLETPTCKRQLLCLPSGRRSSRRDMGQKRQV